MVIGSMRGGVLIVVVAVFGLPALALAHVERPAYFPDPAPEQVGGQPAGGDFPEARSLSSALRRSAPGTTRVVCQPDSMELVRRSIRRARAGGYDLRPSDRRGLSRRMGRRYLDLNRRFAEMCEFRHIQEAVNASGNNDRIVVMPGVYTEEPSRARPTDDPECQKYEVDGDPPGRKGAASYLYQWHCPNDANLIAVMGREPGPGQDPNPAPRDRHGIPNEGPCLRCNLQIEGSTFDPEDTVIEAGDPAAGNGGPSAAGHEKDIGIRADRADGFVLRNMTVRHARENGIYVLETDGYLLDRFKAFYNGLYGTLTFVDDHGITQNCEGAGHGDSALYPGAPVESGEQRPSGTGFRYNQIVRFCDMYHNLAGYSATNGNAVWIHHNNFWDNALGFNTDVVTSPGHPGFPGDSMLVEENNFFSNNYNLYAPEPPETDVEAAFPYPIGTGLWIAGGNNHTVRNNRFWDNWRRGIMLFAVPDALICGDFAPLAPDGGNHQAGCSETRLSTSHRNEFYGNVMGIAPDGQAMPNGTDFWWDSFPTTRENCWFSNRGAGPITTSPAALPDCEDGRRPEASIGLGAPANEAELISCAVPFVTRDFESEPQPCPWLDSPERPRSRAARREEARQRRAALQVMGDFCAERANTRVCDRRAAVPARR